MSEKAMNLGIRASAVRRKFLRQLSLDTGKSVQRLVDDAIDAAYAANAGDGNQPAVIAENRDGHTAQNEDSRGIPQAIQSGHLIEAVTAEEWRRVSRVLRIVRVGAKEALAPLDTNLDAFVLLADFLKGAASGNSKGVGIPHSREGIPRAMENLRAGEQALGDQLAEDLKDASATRKAAERLGRPKNAPRRRRKETA